MARRNPSNERYGKYTSPAGKTRKSAASAKPKRAIANGTAPAKKKAASAASKKKSALFLSPTTPEYKRWRLIWWILLGGAIVLSTGAWWLWQDKALRPYGNWVLGAGYAMIFAALAIDWLKLRPLRQEWIASGGAEAAAKADTKSADQKSTSKKSDES